MKIDSVYYKLTCLYTLPLAKNFLGSLYQDSMTLIIKELSNDIKGDKQEWPEIPDSSLYSAAIHNVLFQEAAMWKKRPDVPRRGKEEVEGIAPPPIMTHIIVPNQPSRQEIQGVLPIRAAEENREEKSDESAPGAVQC